MKRAQPRRAGQKQNAALVSRIAVQPTAKWLTGGQQPARQVAATFVDGAQRAHAIAQLVLYNIPNRDCHGLSGGGAANASGYLDWVRQVMAGIGNDNSRFVVFLSYRLALTVIRSANNPTSTPTSVCAVLSHFRLGWASCKGAVPGWAPLELSG